jgi:hypothetical protein
MLAELADGLGLRDALREEDEIKDIKDKKNLSF